jgi:NAD(P)-dependent dehydrogenase (short-subunit alcohol dehydrogenase family)
VQGLEVANESAGAYNASKAGVILLSKNIATDYGQLGIRCNAICPGYIETPMLAQANAYWEGTDKMERVREQHTLGRLGR